MATLNISDLSVGDWVRCRGRNGRIECLDAIRDYERIRVAVESYLGTMYQFVGIEDIEPIPITAEILKKIGFEESTDLFTAYYADKVWISYDQRSETWGVTINFDVMPTLYVKLLHIHQLQHALRLAGLDKEIYL